MSMKTIALCMNIPELMEGKFRSRETCKKYPGSGWAPVLYGYDGTGGVKVASGTEVTEAHGKGLLSLENVYVLQEELNETGLALVERGAKPWLMFCLEAPLFTPFFYDKLQAKFSLITMFKHRLFFGKRGTEPVYFPSFDLDDLQDPEPYFSRKKICAVVSNKHYSQYKDMFGHSPSWQRAIRSQLHDNRFEAFEALLRIGAMDLYGKGWPPGVARELAPGEKIKTIRQYQTSICGENMVMEGYITEKIIECMLAGVVPAYVGAPDIANYIPPECYPGHHMEKPEPLEVIAAGQKFLRSPEGRKFSYQGWAEHLLELLAQEGDNDSHHDGNDAA